MNKRTKALLFEAFRRNRMADEHERSKPLDQRWLGLGTAAAYRPAIEAGLMAFHDGKTPPKGCMGWLVLTIKGITVLSDLWVEFDGHMKNLERFPEYLHSINANYMLAGGITA